MTDPTARRPDQIARLNAALEDRYVLERELGEGGMAKVYLAEDLKHERKVALKVLKPELAAVVGADRFLAEIKTTANLQHPHILPLFDSGVADGFLFYAMPYVEGETLGDRLEREKQLPVDEAVRIATDVAEALHAAHKRGVIHRDIKPANILLSEGRPLVADFGIALAVSTAGGGRLTETGLSMGTPYYMSPEQASADREPSAASDVYSLGCVLYEMLVGDPPHVGSSAQAVLAKILTADAPTATDARPSIPRNVDAAVRKALEKLPADRFSGAEDFAKAIGDPGFRHGEVAPVDVFAGPGPWNRLTPILAAATIGLAGLAAWGWLRPATVPSDGGSSAAFRMDLAGFRLVSPIGGGERLAISRDGTRIVLSSAVDGVQRLYVRDAGDVAFSPIPGTEGGGQPTLSPDGEWVAFDSSDGEVKRVALAGGPVLPVAVGVTPRWGLDGSIVFARAGEGIYHMVSADEAPTLVWADSANNNLPRPNVLPDGEAIVFQGAGDIESRTLMLLELGSGEVTDLGIPGNNPRYAAGHLLYGHSSQALRAVPFDLATHQVTGAPVTVLPEVLVFNGGATQFVVSETGTAVVGLPGIGGQDRELVIVGLDGSERALPLRGDFSHPRFSPGDGQRIAYERGRQIWTYDLVTGANDRLTGGDNYRLPWWSPDGEYVYYSGYTVGSSLSNSYDGLRTRADASEAEERLYTRPLDDTPTALTLDGRLLVEAETPDRGRDLLLMTLDADGGVFSDYLRGSWNETTAAVSPDGAWAAYMSDESDVPEIYVRAFPEADRAYQVSVGGGTQPVWEPDGSGIYYRNADEVMRTSVRTAGGFAVEAPERLFTAEWLVTALGRHDWDIHPDGTSFVAVRGTSTDETEVGGVPVVPVQIIVNWFEELKQRTGG